MTEYVKKPDDKELAALYVIVEEFEKIKGDKRAVERIIDYIKDRYDGD